MNSPKTTYWNFSEWSTLKKIQNGSLLLFVALAYLVPMDVLDRFPQFIPFVEFMAGWNVQIRRVGEFSGPASQVNMFVYSVAWCLIPIPWTCEVIDAIQGRNQIGRMYADSSFLRLLISFVFATFFIWFVSAWPGTEWPLDTRIARAVFLFEYTRPIFSIGMVYFAGASLMVHVLVVRAMAVKLTRPKER